MLTYQKNMLDRYCCIKQLFCLKAKMEKKRFEKLHICSIFNVGQKLWIFNKVKKVAKIKNQYH